MTKIVVSLRSVFIMNGQCLAYGNPEPSEIKYYPKLRFFIKIDRIPQL
jgi:hypothetical protein